MPSMARKGQGRRGGGGGGDAGQQEGRLETESAEQQAGEDAEAGQADLARREDQHPPAEAAQGVRGDLIPNEKTDHGQGNIGQYGKPPLRECGQEVQRGGTEQDAGQQEEVDPGQGGVSAEQIRQQADEEDGPDSEQYDRGLLSLVRVRHCWPPTSRTTQRSGSRGQCQS
jgi:hypothetical protein